MYFYFTFTDESAPPSELCDPANAGLVFIPVSLQYYTIVDHDFLVVVNLVILHYLYMCYLPRRGRCFKKDDVI